MTTRTKNDPQKDTTRNRKVPVLVIVFIAVAGLLIAAMLFGGGNQADAGEQFGTPEISGARLPIFPRPPPQSPDADPAFAQAAPEVIGEDFEGNAVSIEHDGTPKAIVFLAHWCPHCQAEVPRVTEWFEQTGGIEGVEIISVATSIDRTRTNYPPSAWLTDEEWPFPLIRDDADNSVLISYGAGGFPYWVFLDAEGKVVARSAGQLPIVELEIFLRIISVL